MKSAFRGLAFLVPFSYDFRVLEAIRKRVRNENGQVMMEYSLLLIVILVATAGFSIGFQRAIKSYLLGVYFWMSLPIP